MEKRTDKNEILNQIILRTDTGKLRLSKYSLRFSIALDNVSITESKVSMHSADTYLSVDFRNHELVFHYLTENEVYVYTFQENEVKVKVTQDTFYLYIQIDELKPLSQAVLCKVLESLEIPFAKIEGIRLDIDITKYHEFEYDSDDGLQLRYGVSYIQIKRDRLVVNGLAIDLFEHGWYATFEKGIMSIIF